MKAVILLIVAGFLGGFVLSGGSGRLLKFARSTSTPGQAADDGNDLHFELEQKGGKHGAVVSGNGGPKTRQDGPNDQAAGGRGKAPKQLKEVQQEEGDDPPSEPAAPPVAEAAVDPLSLVGDKAVAFLVGNTLKIARGKDRTVFRFMSPRGWQADREDGQATALAHRWIMRGNRLCEFTSEGGLDCQMVTVKMEPTPKEGAGALLGTLSIANKTVAWPVLRGNVGNLPELLPLIVGERLPPGGSLPADALPRRGAGTVAALVGRALLVRDTSRDLHAMVYGRNGDMIDVRPLDPVAKTGMDGVRLSISRWTESNGNLCVERPGVKVARDCFTPEQWGEGTFRLLPSGPGPVQTVKVMAETR